MRTESWRKRGAIFVRWLFLFKNPHAIDEELEPLLAAKCSAGDAAFVVQKTTKTPSPCKNIAYF
jgi:hypothetical protein